MIALLEKQFEEVKELYAGSHLLPIFAKFEIEKIMKDVDESLKILKTVEDDVRMKRRFLELKKQLVEFDDFLTGFLAQDCNSL